MVKTAEEAQKEPLRSIKVDKSPPEETSIEDMVKNVNKGEQEEAAGEQKKYAAKKDYIPDAVKQAALQAYSPQEYYKGHEQQPQPVESTEQEKPEKNEDKEQDSAYKDTVLEWERGLRDEDAIYKDPVRKVQDFARDFTNAGKRFLDKRAQKYKPS